jgi:uncharacterized protein YaaW (UPF0174 family)
VICLELKYFIGEQEQTKERFEEVLYFAASSDLRNNIARYLMEYKSYDSTRYMHEGMWLYLENKHYNKMYKEIMDKSEIKIDGVSFKIAS